MSAISEFKRAALHMLVLLLAVAVAAALIEWVLVHRIESEDLWAEGWWRHSLKHLVLVAGLEGAILALCLPLRFVERITNLRDFLSRTLSITAMTLLVLFLLSLYVTNFLTLTYRHAEFDRSIFRQVLDGAPQALAAHPVLIVTIGFAVFAIAAATMLVMSRICRHMAVFIDGIFGTLPHLAYAFKAKDFSRQVVGSTLATSAIAGFCLSGFFAWAYIFPFPNSWYNDVVAEAVLGLPSPQKLLGITISHSNQPIARASARNIIIILSDSLRADHFPQYGYTRMTTPFLAKLAKTGHLWKANRAVSTCSETACGIPGVLLSNTFTKIAGHTNPALHTLLHDAGYEIDFLTSGSHLSLMVLKAIYGDLADFNIFSDSDLSGRGTDDRQILDALDAVSPAGLKPHFFFIFLMSTHFEGMKFPEYRTYVPQRWLGDAALHNLQSPGNDPLLPTEHAQVVNDYDNGLRQMDDFIRRIFEKLTAKGYLSNSIVFISSDHAEALGEHGYYTHGYYIYPEFVSIPLFIYDTSDRVYPNIPFASQTDIAATAVTSIGLAVPPSWDGIDLAGGVQRRQSYVQNFHRFEPPCRGVYYRPASELYYLLSCKSAQGKETEKLFDISTDPLGLSDIRESIDPSILTEMQTRLRAAFPAYHNFW